MRTFAVLALLAGSMCLAQDTASISLSNGVRLKIESDLGPSSGQQTLHSVLATASGNSFYRVFRDQNGLVVYCYELAVDRPSGGDEFRLTTKPAGAGFAAKYPNADGGKPVPTMPAARELPPMHSGDRLPIEVFEMPGGSKVVDTVELRIEPIAAPASASAGLRFAGLKVYISGNLVPGPPGGAVSGRFAMFYVPGRGGYFFSSDMPAGRTFLQAGSIDRTRMQFTIENETFNCVTDAPILGKADRGEIWVYHDPGYKPGSNWTQPLNAPASSSRDEFFAATANTLNWWLPEQAGANESQ